MPASAIILTAAILVSVLASDLGRRAVTGHRLLRPLLTAGAAGALYLTGFASSGASLAIELAGAGAGVALGLLAGGLMRIEHDPRDGGAFSYAGGGYALLWIVTASARLAFIYGSEHWFSGSLGSWMLAHHVSSGALTNSLVLLALAMAVSRTLSLLIRSRRGSQGSGSGVEILNAGI